MSRSINSNPFTVDSKSIAIVFGSRPLTLNLQALITINTITSVIVSYQSISLVTGVGLTVE